MFGVVEKRDRIVIAPEQKNFSIELQESVQARAEAKRIVPRLVRDEVVGVSPPNHKACYVKIDA